MMRADTSSIRRRAAILGLPPADVLLRALRENLPAGAAGEGALERLAEREAVVASGRWEEWRQAEGEGRAFRLKGVLSRVEVGPAPRQ